MTKFVHKQFFEGGHGDVVSDLVAALRYRFLNGVLSNPGLAIGTGSKKEVKVVNRLDYANDGELLSIASATEKGFTATDHDITNAGGSVQEAVYLFTIKLSDNSLVVTKGTTATGTGNAVVPSAPSGQIPFGTVRIAVAAGATPFDATTHDLDAGHLTVTYKNRREVAAVVASTFEEFTTVPA